MSPSEREEFRPIRFVAAMAAGIAVAVSVIALLGWVFDIVPLQRVFSGLATMKANTAICILLCGTAELALNRRNASRPDPLAVGLAALAATIAGLSLVEICAGVNLHIDQALVLDHLTAPARSPGRPSPATAIGLFFISVALGAVDVWPLITQLLATISLSIATLALLGYAFGISELYAVRLYSSMALHTAVAVVLLCCGALLVRPAATLPRLFVSRSRGGRLARGLLPATLLIPLVFGWCCLLGYRRGWYAYEFGFALFALSNIITFTVLIWMNATFLETADARQHRVELDRDQLLIRERTARTAAENAVATRDRLLSVVSHELRTPLQPVMLVAEALAEREDLVPEVRSDIALIREQLQAEVQLIDDLLDVVRLREAKLSARRDPLDVNALVIETAETFRKMFVAASITLSVEPVAGKQQVLGDRGRLRQVVTNLLGNALKFTPAGGTVRVITESADHRFRLSVCDTGVGISAEDMGRIFGAFEQADASTTRRFGGLGLGLMISRRLIEIHGGTLGVSSEGSGRGARFFFELPLVEMPDAQDTHSPIPSTTPAATSRAEMGRRLLLVEDNPQTLKLLKRLLSAKGYAVTAASSATEALSIVSDSTLGFDILISDIGMPDLSGWELMARLGKRVPPRAIAVSGFVTEADRQKSLASGFTEHLAKPIDLERLLAAIERPTTASPRSADVLVGVAAN